MRRETHSYSALSSPLPRQTGVSTGTSIASPGTRTGTRLDQQAALRWWERGEARSHLQTSMEPNTYSPPSPEQPSLAHIDSAARRVLVYRLGSLGDTVVALPCFHLIARTYPNAERILLTNTPVNARAPAAAAVLGESGLIHRYIQYPVGSRNPFELARLALQLRRLRADVLVYLAAPRGPGAVRRDARFFRFCGFRSIIGLPVGELGVYRRDASTGLLEAESHRLARSIAVLGDARLEDNLSWDFHLSPHETATSAASIRPIGTTPYIVCAPGCKAPANDWEDANWTALFHALSRRLSAAQQPHALILTGAESERTRNEHLRASWQGPTLNLCGNSPREAVALLSGAALYLGPDSGPMHLAAAVGTPCVAVFSARLPLGIWFPRGAQGRHSPHRVLYHRTACSPCGLDICTVENKRCLMTITPAQVCEAAILSLAQEPSLLT